MRRFLTLCIFLSGTMYLAAQNNVGIGLTNPQYVLHIEDHSSGPQFMVENPETFGWASIDVKHNGGAALLRFRDDSAIRGGLAWDKTHDKLMMFIYGFPYSRSLSLDPLSGDVGIGTMTAHERLHVYKDGTEQVGLMLSNTTTGVTDGLHMYVVGSGASYIKAPEGAALFLSADPGTPGGRVHLYTNGHVGINTGIAADYDLEVEGDFATRMGNALIDGNLGVGTKVPVARAHIMGSTSGPQLLVGRNAGSFTSIDIDNNGSGNSLIRFRGGGTFYGGLYFDDATDNMTVYSNSSPDFHNIALNTTSGNVGIGTKYPNSRVHMYENGASTTRLRMSNTSTGINDGLDMYINGAGTGYIESPANSSLFLYGSNGSGGALKLYTNGHVGVNTSTVAAYDLEVQGDFATRSGNAFIDGFLGVGISSPMYQTHIAGDVPPQLLVQRIPTAYFTAVDIDNGGSGASLLRFRDGNTIYGGLYWDDINDVNKLFVYGAPDTKNITLDRGSGYVGIGLNNAATKLHIHKPGAENTILRLSNANTGANGLDIYVSGSGVGYMASATDKALFLSADRGSGGNVNLYTNGHVGINTGTLANYDLEVEGDFATRSGSAFVDGNLYVGTTTTSGYRARISHGIYGLDIHRTSTNNHWEFYVTSPSTNADLYLYYNGSSKGYFSASTGEYLTSSDRRLKTQIQPVTHVLSNVLKLQPVRFYFNSDEARTRKSIGFIAQDVEPLFPDLVSVSNDDRNQGTYSLNYSGFGILAIAAIQEQQAQIEDLKEENKDLKNRLERLENQVRALMQ